MKVKSKIFSSLILMIILTVSIDSYAGNGYTGKGRTCGVPSAPPTDSIPLDGGLGLLLAGGIAFGVKKIREK